MEMFIQQDKVLPSCSQDSMEAMRPDTIIIYTLWLEAELGTGQAIGRIGDKDTTILKLQQNFCPVSQYLHLFSCYFIFLFGRYLTYLYLIFPIREIELLLLLSHRIIVRIKCINTCSTLRIVILETSNVSMK